VVSTPVRRRAVSPQRGSAFFAGNGSAGSTQAEMTLRQLASSDVERRASEDGRTRNDSGFVTMLL
jgi:hypothetical protein